MIYGKLPVVLLTYLASEDPGSTNSSIASYILKNIDKTKDMSIVDFSRACNVSISSISRFCRDIGLNDFFELKDILLEPSSNMAYKDVQGDFSKRLAIYTDEVARGLDRVKKSLDEKKLAKLVEDIASFSRIAIFGLMKAEAAALSLTSDLYMVNKVATTYLSFKKQIYFIKEAKEDDLIIIFSFSNSYFDYSSIKRYLNKKNRARIWVISSNNKLDYDFIYDYIKFDSGLNYFDHPSQLNFIASIIFEEYRLLIKR